MRPCLGRTGTARRRPGQRGESRPCTGPRGYNRRQRPRACAPEECLDEPIFQAFRPARPISPATRVRSARPHRRVRGAARRRRTDRIAAARPCRAPARLSCESCRTGLHQGRHPDPLCCAQRVGRSAATGRTAVARRSAKTGLAGLDAARTRAPEGCAGAAPREAGADDVGRRGRVARPGRSSRTVTAAGRARADGGPAWREAALTARVAGSAGWPGQQKSSPKAAFLLLARNAGQAKAVCMSNAKPFGAVCGSSNVTISYASSLASNSRSSALFRPWPDLYAVYDASSGWPIT